MPKHPLTLLTLMALAQAACVSQPTTQPGPGSPTSPTAQPSATPTTSPSASAIPSTSPPAPTATPEPTPSASLPPADPNQDISVNESTTFNGQVFDDNKRLLDSVTVTARSLSSSQPFEASTETLNGTYVFNQAPAGVQIEIIARREGHTTRSRVEVLKSNKQGDPSVNRYDFGSDGTTNSTGNYLNALSDKPEVIAVSPARNAADVNPATDFVMTFSEPMDTQSVENAFAIRAYSNKKLSVDASSSSNTFSGNGLIGIWNGSESTATIANGAIGTPIWNKDAFSILWNSDQTEATFYFSGDRTLPTDSSSSAPEYRISFDGLGASTFIRDKNGNARNHHHFRLPERNFEDSYRFGVRPDNQGASLNGLSSRNGGLILRYSKRMLLDTYERPIFGGMDGVVRHAAAAHTSAPGAAGDPLQVAANYSIEIRNSNGLKLSSNWADLGGEVIFDNDDVTYKSVLLQPPLAVYDQNFSGIMTHDTLNLSVSLADGQVHSATFTAPEDIISLSALQNALNTPANWGGAYWKNSPFSLQGNNLNNALLLLAATARFDPSGAADSTGTAVRAITLNGREIFAGTQINTAGRWVYFAPGDQIQVRAASSILDPSGNALRGSLTASTIGN